MAHDARQDASLHIFIVYDRLSPTQVPLGHGAHVFFKLKDVLFLTWLVWLNVIFLEWRYPDIDALATETKAWSDALETGSSMLALAWFATHQEPHRKTGFKVLLRMWMYFPSSLRSVSLRFLFGIPFPQICMTISILWFTATLPAENTLKYPSKCLLSD